jgi:hypothetical protein
MAGANKTSRFVRVRRAEKNSLEKWIKKVSKKFSSLAGCFRRDVVG